MHRKLLPLMLAALTVVGCRDLVAPTEGYVIIESILHPVPIRTKNLEGVGWIEAFMPHSKVWDRFFVEPQGSFVFNETLPLDVWHCDPLSGVDGCVAKLRAGDEKGFLATGRQEGAIYVCTESYIQKVGRKHCGKRAFETYDPFDPDGPKDIIELYSSSTHGVLPWEFPDETAVYAWHGDPMSRLFAGDSYFPHAESYHPPAEGSFTGRWNEFPYTPGERIVTTPLSSNVSTDTGACSVFLPYEWKNRINDLFTTQIGAVTGNRGFAELLIDGILQDPPPPDIRYEQDVMFWADATAVIKQRRDVSPEFHFRVGNGIGGNPNGDLVPQFCLKNYMTASNDLNGGVEDWYRWDQGFLSAFTGLFNIGTCRAHPVSMMYCGSIGMKDGHGYFQVAPDVATAMEDYSVFKPACRNKFRPQVLDGLKDGARTAGAENMSDGIDFLVQSLQDTVRDLFSAPSFVVRRLELTPTGIYVVTASSTFDAQYAYRIGNCVGDLHTPKMNPMIQPAITVEYSTRGITRPVP